MSTIRSTIRAACGTLSLILGMANPATADVRNINELLKEGYEIKAAFSSLWFKDFNIYNNERVSPEDMGITLYLILQRGVSAYKCDNSGAASNEAFRCYSIRDYDAK
jgi:hypothetical protein